MIIGVHPVNRTYQVQFITLKTPDEVAAELLESQMQSLQKGRLAGPTAMADTEG